MTNSIIPKVPPTHVIGNKWSLVDGDLARSSVVLVEISKHTNEPTNHRSLFPLKDFMNVACCNNVTFYGHRISKPIKISLS